MATQVDAPVVPVAAAPSDRGPGLLLLVGGLLVAAGGASHPKGSGATVEEHLESMFASPAWAASHLVALAGFAAVTTGLALARRRGTFGRAARAALTLAVVGWSLGTVEQVPHLLAAGEADALAHHDPTPVLSLHEVLQVVATPAVGLTGALLAVAVSRGTRTWATRLLAVPAVVGGLLYAAAAPLVSLTWDPAWTALFPWQAGLAVWVVGIGVLLVVRRAPAR